MHPVSRPVGSAAKAAHFGTPEGLWLRVEWGPGYTQQANCPSAWNRVRPQGVRSEHEYGVPDGGSVRRRPQALRLPLLRQESLCEVDPLFELAHPLFELVEFVETVNILNA